MSIIVVDGSGGGAFTDQSGSEQITFGSAAATLTAGQGSDTVVAGSGPLLVEAKGDSNPVSISGGSGALVYAGGPGSATVAGGAGTVVILPSNGSITFDGGGGLVDIYSASSWSGYAQLSPPAGDTLTLSFDELAGDVDVLDHASGRTLVIGQGFDYYADASADDSVLADPPVTIFGFTAATQAQGAADSLTTADASPVLAGAAPPNSTVTLTDAGGRQVGSPVQADAQGDWQVALPTLPFGPTTLTATASSFAGGGEIGGESPAVVSVRVVPSAPEITGFVDGSGSHSGAGQTLDRQPEIDGTTQAGTTVNLLSDGELLGAATVTGTTWSYVPTSPLPEGVLSLTAVSTDVVSGVSSEPSASQSLAVLLAPPTVDGITDDVGFMTGGDTLDHTPALSGTAPDGTVVNLFDQGTALGSASVVAGAWSFTPAQSLLDGVHVITAVAIDVVTGAVSAASAPLSFTVDPGAPSIEVLAGASGTHSSGDTVSDAALSISGTTDLGTTVAVSDGGVALGEADVSGSSWSFALPTGLSFGAHSLTAAATDPSDGLVSAASDPFAFVEAPPAPVIAGLTPATDTGPSSTDGITSDTDPVITGSAVAGDVVTVFDGSATLGSVLAGDDGTWQLMPAAPLAYGPHTLTATDSASDGEAISRASASLTIIVTAPSAAITAIDGTGDGQPVASGATADSSPTLSGTGPVGCTVGVYDGATLLAQSGTIGADGTWSLVLPTPLSPGLHTLDATTMYGGGNVAEPSATLSLVVNPPPEASQPGEDAFATAIRSSISASLGGDGEGAVVYQQPGQPSTPVGPGQLQGLSIDDSMAGQVVAVPTGTEFVSDISAAPVTVLGSNGARQIAVSTGGDLTYAAGSGSAVLLADQSTGDNIVFGSTSAASQLVAATGSGDDIFVTQNSNASLSGGAGANQFWLGSGQSDVNSNGADTIVAGSGSLTVTGGADTISATDGHSDLVFGGSGALTFYNADGGSTVAAGSGSSTLIGGQGPTLFFGGKAGGNILVGGAGPSTLVGGGDGDLLYANGPGDNILAAGGDNATLCGGASTGDNIYFGGSGQNVIAAGNGNDTIAGGTGRSTIFAGSGDDLVFGADGGGVIAAGSGNATLVGAAGPELYDFVDGRVGGDVLIYGFRPGADLVTFQGYAQGSIAMSLAAQTNTAGSTQIVLPDGTHVTFSGLADLQPGSVV